MSAQWLVVALVEGGIHFVLPVVHLRGADQALGGTVGYKQDTQGQLLSLSLRESPHVSTDK